MPSAKRSFCRSGRATRAEIDAGAFASNLRLAAKFAGERAEVMAVLKADAYGHGAVELACTAAGAGASCVGVATLDEARELRLAGVKLPVFVLSELHPSCAAEAVSLDCTAVVYTPRLAEALEEEGRRAGRRVAVHLKVDTGMGRVGVSPGEVPEMVRLLRGMPHLRLEGVLSHLPEADRLESTVTREQVRTFEQLCGALREQFADIRYFHIANSALLMRKEAAGNLVRPGIMLYGAPPAPGFPGGSALRPVMTFLTAVSFLKRVPAGTPLSYGGTFVTGRESLIATLPVGYADGYSRVLSNRSEILVRGRRVPQVGTVCMDLTLADVTGVPGVSVGDEAVLLGRQGGEEVNADELAGMMGTISYEVFCSVGARVPRLPRPGQEGEPEE